MTCRPLPLPDASCQALIAFTRAAATAAGAGTVAAAAAAAADSNCTEHHPQQQQQPPRAYSVQDHALLLEGLAVTAASRDTAAAALEGLVELAGGTADWMVTRPGQDWQQGQQEASALRDRYMRNICVIFAKF
jgi:hypothetical protein